MGQKILEPTKRKPRWVIHLLFFVTACLAPIGAAYFVTEVYMAWYLYQTGTLRAAQSDNYQLAFYGVLLALATIAVSLGIVIFFWLKNSRNNKKAPLINSI